MAAPTISGGTVGTGGTYATWAAWFAAAPADLTVANVIWQGRQLNQELVSAGTMVTLTGKVASATCYFEMTAEVGASFNDHADKATNALRYNALNGASMRVTGDNAAAVRSEISFTRISKLQMSSTSVSMSTFPLIFRIDGSLDVNQCILEGFCSGTEYSGLINLYNAGSFLRNSVVISKASNVSAIIASFANGAESHNNTLVSLNAVLTVGVSAPYAAMTAKNTYIGGCVTPINAPGQAPILTSCATSATAAGYTTVPMTAATFQNVTNGTHDFRLAAGSALIDAGTTDATYAATGILGTARPQGTTYDIGAYELPVAPDTTAPLLTVPTGTSTGTTTASGTVSTNEANGTLYSLATVNATETAATVKASGATQVIASVGSKSAAATGLTPSTAYYFHYVHRDAAGNDSIVSNGASFTTAAVPVDTVAPILSAPSATATSGTAVTGTVATDEGGGVLYFWATANATETAAAIKASGGTQTVSATGTRTVYITGLTPGSTYYLHYVQTDAAASPNTSAVVNSASFAMPAPDTAAPTFASSSAITPGTITSSTLAFTYPAATDNVGVSKYQTSKDSGATWQDNGTGLSGSFSGLAAGTTFPIWVRAVDAQSNNSTPLQISMTTSAAAAAGGTFTTDVWISSGTIRANQTFTGTWYSGGSPGTAGGTAMLVSGTLSAAGTAALTGLTSGAGFLIAKTTDGGRFYQEGTAA